eukprot:1185047-Amphidinium_carterae.1
MVSAPPVGDLGTMRVTVSDVLSARGDLFLGMAVARQCQTSVAREAQPSLLMRMLAVVPRQIGAHPTRRLSLESLH